MKKTLFAMMAAVALAACNSDEVVNVAERQAITFDDAFVDNSTRAALDGSYNSNNLGGFKVYGTITGGGKDEGTANIFNGEIVVRGNSLGMGDSWSYAKSNTQYWIPGNTYNFVAIADKEFENVSTVVTDAYGMPTFIQVTDASQQKDILYAERLNINYNTGDNTKVGFTFNHILSKAKFTYVNAIETNNGYSYKVKNIAIENASKSADFNTLFKGWYENGKNETYKLEFGHAVIENKNTDPDNIPYNNKLESKYERLLIPTNQPLTLSFEYELLKDGIIIDTQSREISTGEIKLLAGYAYNFIISLPNPGEPIKFSVVGVNNWIEPNDIEINN